MFWVICFTNPRLNQQTLPLESLEFTPGLIAIRQDKDRNDHTYQTGDTPNIPGHTSYVCEVVTDTFTHTHLKRESKWKESLAYSHRKECRPGGSDSCCSQGPGDNSPRRTGTCISPNSWQSQNEASRHLLKPYSIAYISPFSPHFFLIPTLSILFSLLLTKPEFQCVFGLILWVSLI